MDRRTFSVEYACCEDSPDEFAVVADDRSVRIGSVMDPLTREQADTVVAALNAGEKSVEQIKQEVWG